MAKLKLAIVVGSNRRESINRKLAQALARLGEGAFEPSFVQIDDLPMFNQDLEPNRPEPTLRLKREIEAADAILIVTPEYNRAIPAVLKNAIDWASRPYGKSSWAGKPGAIVGATGGAIGTAVAQSHLRSIMAVLDVALMGQPEVYFTMKPGLIDEDYLITDDKTHEFLSSWVNKYTAWVRRFAVPQQLKIAAE
jgi:chromate reductase